MGNDISSGPGMSIVYVRYMDLDNNFTNKYKNLYKNDSILVCKKTPSLLPVLITELSTL